jgi:hypothetical protein
LTISTPASVELMGASVSAMHDPPHGVASVQARAFESLVDQRNRRRPETRRLNSRPLRSGMPSAPVLRADLVHDERLIVGDRAGHFYAPAAVAERWCRS